MPPKSERFELRLDEAFLARIDAWRLSEPTQPSRAEAVRLLVDKGLKTETSDSPSFSDGEKLLTFMLAEVMQAVVKKPAIDPDFIADVMSSGDYWAISFANSGVFPEEECPRETVSEVIDILDMCDFLEISLEKLSEVERKRLKDSFPYVGENIFVGFDGNADYNHIGVTRILVEKLGRFSRFKGRSRNSHSPSTLGRYRQMYRAFEPLRNTGDGMTLPFQAVERILEAGYEPTVPR